MIVQDLWERSFKEVGEDNPEQTVTGMLLFYPFQLVGYLEVITLIKLHNSQRNKEPQIHIISLLS